VIKKARLVLALVLCGILGTVATGCGAEPANSAMAPTSGTVFQTTQTLQSTTTIRQPGTFGIDPELVSRERALGDVRGDIPQGEGFAAEHMDTVPADLQQSYREIMPGYEIWWALPANRGLELNAAAVTMPFEIEGTEGSSHSNWRFFSGDTPVVNGFYRVSMIFEDVILIPGSEDFYIRGSDPVSGSEDLYLRVMAKGNGKNIASMETHFILFDLGRAVQPQLTYEQYEAGAVAKVLEEHGFSEIVQKGDRIFILTTLMGTSLSSSEGLVDERGVQEANWLIIGRLQGAEEMRGLLGMEP